MAQELRSTNRSAGEKSRPNIYTMMLLLSLLAIILACALLLQELNTYADQWQWWGWWNVR